MRKRNIFVFFLILSVLVLPSQTWADRFRIGLGANFYSSNNSLFKEFYGNQNFILSAHAGFSLFKFLEIRAELGRLKTSGEMSISKENLGFRMQSLSFGLRLNLKIKRFQPYLGAGMVRLKTKEDYPDRFEDVSASYQGQYAEAGTYFSLSKRFYTELNICYSSADTADYMESSLGGIRAGLSFGVKF
jgi:hypothetical protein